ncbi:MAG TPA: hypothetical protein VMY37_30530 [Thermoguttaceae bacterium]|nr:hypothetical protein [Thermoguttaceae bacterium]
MRSVLIVGATAVLCLSLAIGILPSQAQSAGGDADTTWEYKCVHVQKLVTDARDNDAISAELEKGLNALGTKGWELCQNVNGGLIFKRPK